MEFSLPEFPMAPGAQAAFAAVCFLILIGLLFLIFPASVGRFLGLESREARPGAIGELRAAGGMLAGLALATLMFDQPVLYTALAIALLISTFGRIVSLMSDAAATMLNILLLAVQMVLTGATLYYFFDVFTPDMQFSVPEAFHARLVYFTYAGLGVLGALVMFGPRLSMAISGLGATGEKASAISTIRSAGGFALGAGLAGMAISNPMVDLGLGVALGLGVVGRIVALAFNRGNYIFAGIALMVQGAGAALILSYVMNMM